MRYGIWSSYWMDRSPEEMVVEFAKNGWYDLELSDEHGRMLLERGEPEKTGNEFFEFARRHGVRFSQGHLWLTCDIVSMERAKMMDELKRWCVLFASIHVQAAVLHPGGRYATPVDAHRARCEVLTELCTFIAHSDMTICLENIPSEAPEAEDLMSIIEDVSSDRLGVCLDTGHLNLCSKRFESFIQKTSEHLKALHIADNDGSSDMHLMPFGYGNVPWLAITRALRGVGYDGLFNLEIPGESKCGDEYRRHKLQYLKKCMQSLLNG